MSCPCGIDNTRSVDVPPVHKLPPADPAPPPTASPSNLSLSRIRSVQRFLNERLHPPPDSVPTQIESHSRPAPGDFGFDAAAFAELADFPWTMTVPDDKGKRVARPADLAPPRRPASEVFGTSLELESGSPSEAGPSISTSPIPIPVYTSADFDIQASTNVLQELAREASSLGKGKQRELELELDPVPTLPPLSFSPSRFDPDDIYPMSPATTGPSSFGSTFSAALSSPGASHAGPARRASVPMPTPMPISVPMAPLLRMPSRRRSLSNLSVHSTHSITARVKGKLRSASPAHIVRRIFSKSDGALSMPVSPLSPSAPAGLDGQAGCFAPWRWDGKRARDNLNTVPTSATVAALDFEQLLYESPDLAGPCPLYTAPSNGMPPAEATLLRAKGRSNSDPFPLALTFASAFDVGADTFAPLSLEEEEETVLPRSTFTDQLPRELQLHVLALLVQLHEEEHAQCVRDGQWTALTAAKHKWTGRDRGVRELVRLSRVCKAWHSLVFDGQLWVALDLHAFPKVAAASLLHVGRSAGSFVQKLDLAGHVNLQASTLEHLTNSLSVDRNPFIGETRLTHVDLAGCRELTATALHYLLDSSPAIVSLSVKALPAVTNETCEVLARSCPRVETLNMARCKSLSGLGIRLLTASALRDGRTLPLRELRLCGMKGVTDGVLEDLGRAAPDLEVLDLSYCRDLHNSSIGAFVNADDDSSSTTVVLSARQAGRDPSEGRRYRRRVTRLRHLALSHCALLTDHACAHLAHAVPALELLELAGIGTDLKDDGLVLLLDTTPRLRKLDLEDALDVSDAVLRALVSRTGSTPCALEHLVVSYATQLSNDAILAFMRAAPRLRVLEADNTNLSGTVAREFVALARARATRDAALCAVDCRALSESVARDLNGTTRPRLGWRAYAARRLAFLDGADEDSAELLGVGQDECDPARVVFKTFYGWQTVDAVAAARQKRKRGRREANASGGETAAGVGGDDVGAGGGGGGSSRARWWTPGGRRAASGSAAMLEMASERDGCIIM